MPSQNEYEGRCFCGAVELRVSGSPVGMGFCHCSSCRAWSAAPVNAFTLWAPNAVEVTRGAEHVGAFSKNPSSIRKWCKTCGGHLFTEHPGLGLIDVYAAVLSGFRFEPGVHVNYAEAALALHDGLPKLRDFPKELGGSGEMAAE